MVYVPEGAFQMGITEAQFQEAVEQCVNEGMKKAVCEAWFSSQKPVHAVTLDGFWLDRTEVTEAQFAAFLNEVGNQEEGGVTWLDLEDGSELIKQDDGDLQPLGGRGVYPIIDVSWYGARAYCEWAGARLPTEAEWEYAARGPEGHIYPWGDKDPTCGLAQYSECSGSTVPVGSLPDGASWCGALDMAGNVWEWVEDWYVEDYYANSPSENPTGPLSGEYRVLRGGGRNSPSSIRSAIRSWLNPDRRDVYFGFRCARDAQ